MHRSTRSLPSAVWGCGCGMRNWGRDGLISQFIRACLGPRIERPYRHFSARRFALNSVLGKPNSYDFGHFLGVIRGRRLTQGSSSSVTMLSRPALNEAYMRTQTAYPSGSASCPTENGYDKMVWLLGTLSAIGHGMTVRLLGQSVFRSMFR